MIKKFVLPVLTMMLVSCGAQGNVRYPWEKDYAKRLPNGDLEYTPKPYQFEPGKEVRYIDFEKGDDKADGSSPETAWKHHPWDPMAKGKCLSEGSKGDTFVFKGGVIYRGEFRPDGQPTGTPDTPVKLLGDPAWGDGPPLIYGSAQVGGWKKGSHKSIPPSPELMMAEVDFLPRAIWYVGSDGKIERLKIARNPNWHEPDPYDPMSEWPTWENPRWWTGEHKTTVNGRERHLGIDTKNFTGPADLYEGATVWSEWGIVMGSPYPSRVEKFDEKQKAVAFRGPWTWEMSEKIIRNNRYYLEDKPEWLDEEGEFWVEQTGKHKARIYLRMPEAKLASGSIEAGQVIHLMDARTLENVEIAGMTFRFSNMHWEYNIPRWAHPDLDSAVVRVKGGVERIRIHNCTFEHVHMPIRLQASHGESIGRVSIEDNVMRHTDHGAVLVGDNPGGGGSVKREGSLEHVSLLRNRMEHIGWRNLSGTHGHAVDIQFPATSLVAGNFLDRIAGWGIAVWGGKPNGKRYAAPFARVIITQNRVKDPLLKSNDWGGIETWQGGSFYVFNNVVINPGGYKNWRYDPEKKEGTPRFGHAYYLDGSFKNFFFNNIAVGNNNELGNKLANTAALQGIIGYQNTFFNNTFYRFVETSRQQVPKAGRNKYLSNIYQDTSDIVLRHADRKKRKDANAEHYKQGNTFDYQTLAYANNIFFDVKNLLGIFEQDSTEYREVGAMSEALKKREVLASSLGWLDSLSTLRDPAGGDLRLNEKSKAVGAGTVTFVPWSLYATVGEWNFLLNHRDPSHIIDEHWCMTQAFNKREEYYQQPTFPLTVHNVEPSDFVEGPLENWTQGVLRLNGKDQYAVLSHEKASCEETAGGSLEKKMIELKDEESGKAFAKVEMPGEIVPGVKCVAKVTPLQASKGQFLNVDVHWMKKNGEYGGFSMPVGSRKVENPKEEMAFEFTPKSHRKLKEYFLLVYMTPDGGYKSHTMEGKETVPAGDPPLDSDDCFTPDVTKRSFVLEAYLKAEKQGTSAVIISKMDKENGYALRINEAGKPLFQTRAGGRTFEVLGGSVAGDDKWHHVLAEADRDAEALRLYVDGKQVAKADGPDSKADVSNRTDLYVGGTPDGECLKGGIEFLRISLGSLKDSRTSIEELYAWQFSGPQFRDFTGKEPVGKRDAGALESDR